MFFSDRIILEQLVSIDGLHTFLSTNEHISNDQLRRFYNDTVDILKNLDPDISIIGDYGIKRAHEKSTILAAKQCLAVEKNGLPDYFHLIRFSRTPLISRFPNSNNTQEPLLIKNNLSIGSSHESYSLLDLADALVSLPYVSIREPSVASTICMNEHTCATLVQKRRKPTIYLGTNAPYN